MPYKIYIRNKPLYLLVHISTLFRPSFLNNRRARSPFLQFCSCYFSPNVTSERCSIHTITSCNTPPLQMRRYGSRLICHSMYYYYMCTQCCLVTLELPFYQHKNRCFFSRTKRVLKCIYVLPKHRLNVNTYLTLKRVAFVVSYRCLYTNLSESKCLE